MSTVTTPQDQRIDDPEEYSQQKRIKEILDRRKELLDIRNQARDEMLIGDAEQHMALLLYRSRLEALIHELWNVFENIESDEGEHYLYEKDLGTIVIEPPDELFEQIHTWDTAATRPEPYTDTIEGLVWYLQNPDVLEATFTVSSFDPPDSVSATAQRVLNWDEIDRGMRACFEFIHTAGIDADLADEEQQTKITRELLEEVDEWRRNQPHIETD